MNSNAAKVADDRGIAIGGMLRLLLICGVLSKITHTIEQFYSIR